MPQAAGVTSGGNGTMVYMSGEQASAAGYSAPRIAEVLAFAVALAVFLGF